MSPLVRLIIGGAVALLVGLWVLTTGYHALYADERDAILAQIDEAQKDVDRFQNALDGRVALQRRRQAYIDRTLGGDRETVDHRLRTRLNRIAEEIQLGGVTVGTGRATTRSTPARSAFRRQRELRDEPDFVELGGWVSGEGTLEQALRLVHRVQGEPWLKRLDQVKLDPKDNGQRMQVTVRLTTLFLPDAAPEKEPAPGDGAGFEPYAALVHVNPFRVPEVAVAAMPETTVESPDPAAFPFGHWQLTGLAQGPDGWEVWLRDTTNGQTRRLAPGQSLDEAVFEGASDGRAVFRLGEARFAVALGGRLDDRSAVDR